MLLFGRRVERAKHLATAARDVEELLSQLEEWVRRAAVAAERLLAERGRIERRKLADTVAALRKETAAGAQLTLQFSAEEKRQVRANIRTWNRRMKAFDRDIETEPRRVRELYNVATRRLGPMGLVYLWPETN